MVERVEGMDYVDGRDRGVEEEEKDLVVHIHAQVNVDV